METIWDRMKAWMQQHAPHLLKELNKGATEQQLDDLEEAIQQKLPASFRAFYKIHNGQDDYGKFILNSQELLSTHRILHEWKIWKTLIDQNTFVTDGSAKKSIADKAIQPIWVHSAWIPFTSNGGGDHYCLDFAPTSAGTSGQVITMIHDAPSRLVLGDSFQDWIEDYVDKLETGFYVYSEEDECIMTKEEYDSYNS